MTVEKHPITLEQLLRWYEGFQRIDFADFSKAVCSARPGVDAFYCKDIWNQMMKNPLMFFKLRAQTGDKICQAIFLLAQRKADTANE